MKNIHLIPTDKLSKLYYWEGKLRLGDLTTAPKNLGISNQNIYITSDEHPKPNDFYFDFQNQKVKKCETGYYNKGSKKIILTDNKDLIEDGVRAIDDEFLEWFVKNPNCEEVEVVKEKQHIGEEVDESYPKGFFDYKIIIPKEVDVLELGQIIPKEEPKQETLENLTTEEITEMLFCNKKETLEEFTKEVLEDEFFTNISERKKAERLIEIGAKWQAERMYINMEEYAEFCIQCDRKGLPCIRSNDWFEQFKNK